jgi:hypothetical protein
LKNNVKKKKTISLILKFILNLIKKKAGKKLKDYFKIKYIRLNN